MIRTIFDDHRRRLAACVALLTAAYATVDRPGHAQLQPGAIQVVDLTHVLDDSFPFIPVPGITFPFRKTPIATIDTHGVAAHRWEIHEHIGTQIDAPNHFIAGGPSLDALPADTLVAPLAVIDISARADRDPDSAMSVADILAWEAAHGRLPHAAAVFMHSGWETRIADAGRFINAGADKSMHFPGISAEAAAFLATERQVAGIGVDTLSIDPGIDAAFRTHRVWLGHGKWAVEVVANLRKVPPIGATVLVGAPNVRGATGGPVRLLATWPRPAAGGNAASTLPGFWEHERCQVQERDGRRVGTRSLFSFFEREWGLAFTQYATERCDGPVLTAVFRGTYQPTGRSQRVPDALDVTFHFARKAMVAHDRSLLDTLNAGACGPGRWELGVERDVTSTGCLAIEPLARCAEEYDIVKIESGRLFLGERPPAGSNLCAAERRPQRLRTEPLRRR